MWHSVVRALDILSPDNQPATIAGTAAIIAALLTVYLREKHGQDQQKKADEQRGTDHETLNEKLNRIINIVAALDSKVTTYIAEHNRRHLDEQARNDYDD